MRWLLGLVFATSVAAAEWVEVADQWVLDGARNRNLGVKIYHPTSGSGPWPVVLFSPGLGGSQWGYRYLGQQWASHGYVSIHISHPGSDWQLWEGKSLSEGLGNLRRALMDPLVFEARVRDLSFLIDSLPLLEGKIAALAGHLDASRIGVAGHSLGASSVLASVGMRVVLGDRQAVDLHEPRIRACLALSPQGLGPFVASGCWEHIANPVFLLTGSDDEQPLESGHGLAWRMDAWHGLQPGHKHLLILPKAEHMTFAGGGLGVHPTPTQLAAIVAATRMFWDVYLRGDGCMPPTESTETGWKSR
jgi:predicted dienelactone hydrolase